jgi:hypothetical protein
MATIDGTGSRQPNYLHHGMVTVVRHHTWAATASVGDVLQMVKVPDGATILDMVVYSTGGDHADIGDGVSVIRFFDSSSALTTQHFLRGTEGVDAGLFHRYDISDAAEPHYETIDLTILVADSSVGDVTTMAVTYTCDQPGA